MAASNDLETVATWWDRWPDSNVGIATGPESGLFVIDVDDLSALDNLPDMPETLTSRTGSGGIHFFFLHPDHHMGNSAGKLAKGIDTRAINGQVVAPPSVNINGEYKWTRRVTPVELPVWVMERLSEKKAKGKARGKAWHRQWDTPTGDTYGRSALERECASVANTEEGQRNHALNAAAFAIGQLVAGGELDEGEAIAALRSAAEAAGLKSGEIEATIQSGMQSGASDPRTKPEREERKPAEPDAEQPKWTRGCPVDNPVVPSGWTISSNGVWDTSRDPAKLASPLPVIVGSRLRDVSTGIEHVILHWKEKNGWRSHTMERERAVNSRKIVDAASVGVPVSSVHASLLVKYIAEAVTDPDMPMSEIITHLGWYKDTFILGDEDSVPRYTPQAGLGDMLKGFTTGGTLAGWQEIIKSVAAHPRALIGLWASFAAPLLKWIPEAPNAIIDYSGRTSTGKTTALRIAASVWGCPDERANGTIHTWQTTRVGLERLAASHRHLPVCLDDHTRAYRPRDIPGFVYDFSIGQGRTRGRADGGLQHRATYRGILISTGEMPLVSKSQDAGTRARVLTCWGSPLENATGDFVSGVNRGLLSQYGHAGREYIKRLSANTELQGMIRPMFEEFRDEFAQGVNSEVGHRLAGSMALIALGGSVSATLGVSVFSRGHAAEVWRSVLGEGEEGADRPLSALAHVYGWCASHSRRFFGAHTRDDPNGGWAGAWKVGEYIGVMPHILNEILSDDDYDSDAIVRQWKDSGYLRGSENRRTLRIRGHGGQLWRVVAIKHSALVDLGIGDTQIAESSIKPMVDVRSV